MIPRKVSHRQAICLGALMGRRWKNLWCNGLHQAPAQSTKPSANHQAPVQSTKPSAKPSWRRNSHALTSHNVCVLQRMNSTPRSGLLLAKIAVNFLSMSTRADLRVSYGERFRESGALTFVKTLHLSKLPFITMSRITSHHLRCWPGTCW